MRSLLESAACAPCPPSFLAKGCQQRPLGCWPGRRSSNQQLASCLVERNTRTKLSDPTFISWLVRGKWRKYFVELDLLSARFHRFFTVSFLSLFATSHSQLISFGDFQGNYTAPRHKQHVVLLSIGGTEYSLVG